MASSENSISVVITCFSEGELILDAIASIFNQSIPPLEIIIVNDASTDAETIAVCKRLEQNPSIQVIWLVTNGGPSVAREAGFQAAVGEILVPLDADDILPPNALQQIQQAFEQFPDAGFIYGNYVRQDQPGESKMIQPSCIHLSRMLSSNRWSPSSQWTLIGTAPLRRTLWQQLGGCDLNMGRDDLHDLEFWIRAISHPTCRYYYIPQVIYIWRRYLGKNSRQVTPLSWYRIAKKHFEVYQQVGLEYRAYELLLLGSKWLGDREAIRHYSQLLVQCIQRGKFKLPTLFALFIPASVFRVLAQYAGKRR